MQRHPSIVFLATACLLACIFTNTTRAADPLNVLLITVDDMNCDSIGVYGCKVKNITPNLDKLASQSMRFERAHVTIAVCQPTRAVWLTGRYPHNNGARGFEQIKPDVPTLLETLHDAGYLTGCFAKNRHMLPSRADAWDVHVQAGQLKTGRDPALYYKHTVDFLKRAKSEGKPFFLAANAQDPHRPFAASAQEAGRKGGKNKNNRNAFPKVTNAYKPNDVTVPGFLPDIPPVRLEMAEYYTSVRRADQVVGEVLRALDESGMADNTLVMFVSDHGMALPFAKTNCYYHSTRTPWMVRWPGKVKAGSIDTQHLIGGIDLTPTVLDILGRKPLRGVDGRSFKNVLLGKPQDGRDYVFTQFHKTSGRRAYEMRAVLDKRFVYIWNPWSDGQFIFRNESQNGRTMKAMVAAGQNDKAIQARVDLFLKRVPEELYDYEKDPDALNNLIDDPNYKAELDRLRARLLKHMNGVRDPLHVAFGEHLVEQSRKSGKQESRK